MSRVLVIAVGLLVARAALADDHEVTPEELAKQLTNPIADLASVPFEIDWNHGVGPAHELQVVLTVEPVVPIDLTDDWNLIGRFIVPFIAQPPLVAGGTSTFGMSDITASLFLSPAEKAHLVWGLGPAFELPGSVDPALGSGTWQAGPTGAVVYMPGDWTIGALANQLWSFAGTGDIPRGSVSQLFVQPFVSYTSGTWTVGATSETTINWHASAGKWSLPAELVVGKLTHLGFLPFSVQAGGAWFVKTPAGGPDWMLSLTFTVLLPKTLRP